MYLLISNMLDCLLRLQPSTISTIWTPHSDTEAPSDRHLLHHQQGRGLRRVSHRTTRWPHLLGFYSLYWLIECIALVLLPVDFAPCEGHLIIPPPHKTFSSATKGQMTLSLRGHLQNSPSDVIVQCKTQPLKLEITSKHAGTFHHISDTLAQNSNRTWENKECNSCVRVSLIMWFSLQLFKSASSNGLFIPTLFEKCPVKKTSSSRNLEWIVTLTHDSESSVYWHQIELEFKWQHLTGG